MAALSNEELPPIDEWRYSTLKKLNIATLQRLMANSGKRWAHWSSKGRRAPYVEALMEFKEQEMSIRRQRIANGLPPLEPGSEDDDLQLEEIRPTVQMWIERNGGIPSISQFPPADGIRVNGNDTDNDNNIDPIVEGGAPDIDPVVQGGALDVEGDGLHDAAGDALDIDPVAEDGALDVEGDGLHDAAGGALDIDPFVEDDIAGGGVDNMAGGGLRGMVGGGLDDVDMAEDEEKNKEEMFGQWITDELGLPIEVAQIFLDEGFDGRALIQECTDKDLRELGISRMGHRKKILLWVRKESVDPVAAPSAAPHPFAAPHPYAVASAIAAPHPPPPPPPPPQPAPLNMAALTTQYNGIVMNTVLLKDERMLSHLRPFVVTAVAPVRFDRLNQAVDAVGSKINGGHRLTRNCAFVLNDAGVIAMSEIHDPAYARSQGRGGNRYYSAKITRRPLSVVYADLNKRGKMMALVSTYKMHVDWQRYSVKRGDFARCVELGIIDALPALN